MTAQLHSKLTFVQRWVFPWVVGGIVVASLLPLCLDAEAPRGAMLAGATVAGLVLLICGLSYRALNWPLMDEAVLTGAAVWVRRGRVEVEIPLSAVSKVTSQTSYNPQRVTLHLGTETALGKEISFMPPGRYLWGRPHPLVAELQRRIAEARATMSRVEGGV